MTKPLTHWERAERAAQRIQSVPGTYRTRITNWIARETFPTELVEAARAVHD